MRLKINERKQRLCGENDLLKVKYEALKNKMQEHEQKVELENKVAQELLQKRAEEYEGKFRNQIRQKDENLFMMKV